MAQGKLSKTQTNKPKKETLGHISKLKKRFFWPKKARNKKENVKIKAKKTRRNES